MDIHYSDPHNLQFKQFKSGPKVNDVKKNKYSTGDNSEFKASTVA